MAMETQKQNVDYEQLLVKCRVFAELMSIYFRCTNRIQEVVNDMVKSIASADTTDEDRERAYGTIAGALLAFAGGEEELSAGQTFRLPIPAETKALMRQQRQALAGRLKSHRVEKSWTQEELARRSGVGQSAISTIESGRCRPQVGTLVKLADALGLDKEDLWPAAREYRNGEPTRVENRANDRQTHSRKTDKMP
jgi:DNA-binding XRE family transcriptional regulator